MSEQTIYSLKLKALPNSAPADVRLARALKALLRCYGLRAIEVLEIPPSEPAAAIGNGQADEPIQPEVAPALQPAAQRRART